LGFLLNDAAYAKAVREFTRHLDGIRAERVKEAEAAARALIIWWRRWQHNPHDNRSSSDWMKSSGKVESATRPGASIWTSVGVDHLLVWVNAAEQDQFRKDNFVDDEVFRSIVDSSAFRTEEEHDDEESAA
jgi:hypothetical protein